MKNIKVIVVVNGGVVTSVYSNYDIDFNLIDFDNAYDNSTEIEEQENFLNSIEKDSSFKSIL